MAAKQNEESIIEATMYLPVTEPYMEQELAAMTEREREDIKRGLKSSYKKMLGEKMVAHVATEDREEVRKKAVELCLKYHPRPIIIRLNTTLNRTFLLNRKYSYHDPNAICETIVFTYGGQAKEMMEEAVNKQWEIRRREEEAEKEEQHNIQQQPKTTTTIKQEEEDWQTNAQEFMKSQIKAEELSRDLDKKLGIRFTKSSNDVVSEEEDEAYIISNPYLTLAELRLREEVESRHNSKKDIWKLDVSNVLELVRFMQRPPCGRLENYLQYYSKEYENLAGFGGGIINNMLSDAVARLKPQSKRANTNSV